MEQTTTTLVVDAVSSGNIDLLKGIAATYTDLTDEQQKKLIMAGSLDVTKTMISGLVSGSTIFAEIAQEAITAAELEMGMVAVTMDENGVLKDPFETSKVACGETIIAVQDAGLRYAKDNIATHLLAVNLDMLDPAAVTLNDIIMEIEKTMLANVNAPLAVVTPYLTSDSDALRASAFVHPNTDNAEIVAVMTTEDEAGNNIDGFKLSMIELLTTDLMITENAEIVAYLLGDTQSAPVQYAMFKNYNTVILNGGATVAGVDTDALVMAYVK